MRIGELLVEQRKLRQSDLTRALTDKPADKRLCSYLITKGLVDFDDAARALGEQRRVACALSKHLAGRDPSLAKLIPAELGRSAWVLPIGRASNGQLIICVRDPSPALLAQLEQATKAKVTMVVTPAARLEHLVRESYGDAPVDEFDIDFSSAVDDNPIANANPLARPTPPTLTAPTRPPLPDMAALAKPTPIPRQSSSPPMPDMAALDPESIRLALTDLDDDRVEKDPTQSGQLPVMSRTTTPTPLPTPLPEPPPPAAVLNAPTVRQPKRARTDPAATRKMSVEMMQIGLEHSPTREAATDLVLAYIGTRWMTGLVLAIRDRKAIGYRGHGVSNPEALSIPLGAPSTVQHAVDSQFVSVQSPQGPSQLELVRALEDAEHPAAAPVMVQGKPAAVIVVGDLIDEAEDFQIAAADLAMLAEALGTAYQRILGR